MINDEDAEAHQRDPPPVERVKSRQPQPSCSSPAVMDRVVKVDSGTSFSYGDLQPSQPCLQCDDMISEGPAEVSKNDPSAIASSFEARSILGKEANEDMVIEKCDSGT
jgi:CLIP-associating protein 1/2